MSKENPQILVYITNDKHRVLSGDPLTLYITDKDERQKCLMTLNIALKGKAIELVNGDHVIISD